MDILEHLGFKEIRILTLQNWRFSQIGHSSESQTSQKYNFHPLKHVYKSAENVQNVWNTFWILQHCEKCFNSNLRLLVIVQSSNIISSSRDKCVYLKLRRFLIIIWVANFSSQTTRTQLFAEDFLWLPIFCDDYVTTENLCDDWTFLINISFPPEDQLCYWHWM